MTNKKISALTSATTPLAGTEVLPIVQSGATVKATIANIVGAGTSPGSFTTLAATDTITQSDKSKTTSFGYQQTMTNAASTASLTRSIDASGNVIDRAYKATGATYALYVHTTGDADQLAYTANADGSVTFTNNLVQGTAAKGVNFTANTPAAGMTSQLLNWYEEGTFTTTWTNLTGTPTSTTLYYTRIGRLVFFTYPAGAAVITGTANSTRFSLPFTPSKPAVGAMITDAVGSAENTLIWTGTVVYPATFSASGLIFSGTYYV